LKPLFIFYRIFPEKSTNKDPPTLKLRWTRNPPPLKLWWDKGGDFIEHKQS